MRKKQIEEMANIIKMSLNALGSGTFNFTGFEISRRFAKALYNANYRKVPEGAVILTKAELDALNKYQERFKGQDAEAVIATEVAKEIIADLVKFADDNERQGLIEKHSVWFIDADAMTDFIAELKKKYAEGWDTE